MTREDVSKDTMVPVKVDGFPMVTKGRIIPNGNNVWIVAKLPGGKMEEGTFSWDAVLEALTVKGVRLQPPNYTPRPATPGIEFLTFTE